MLMNVDTARIRSVRALLVVWAMLALAGADSGTLAATDAMVVDSETQSVFMVDLASGTIRGQILLPVSTGLIGDCLLTRGGTQGFVTDSQGRVWPLDPEGVPPGLAGDGSPIPISNPGQDISFSPDGRFAVVCDGDATAPVSVIDLESFAEISTLDLGSDCNAVEVCEDGSVLVTSGQTSLVRRLILDSAGGLTDTGESLAVIDPVNVTCVPGGDLGVVLNSTRRRLVTFTLNGLIRINGRRLSGTLGLSLAVHPDGRRVFARTDTALFAWDLEMPSGMLPDTPVWSIGLPTPGLPVTGIDQIALDAAGENLLVPQGNALRVYNPVTGLLKATLSDPGMVSLSGVCTLQILDSDDDGLSNYNEELQGTDPDNPDTDGDGLLDGFEVRFGLNPLSASDGSSDPDGDGLDNGAEQAAGTDPRRADTDGDGLDDGRELLVTHTSPLLPDTDGDGLDDGDEVLVIGSDPLLVDTDGGGIQDGQEVLVDDTNPLDPQDDLLLLVLPKTLTDGGGFLWDIQRNGSVLKGSNFTFQRGFLLRVNGEAFPSQSTGRANQGGRELYLGPEEMGPLTVARRVLVPEDDTFARYMETFFNPGTEPVTVRVDVETDLGSDAGTRVVATGDGDQRFTVDDDWLVTEGAAGILPFATLHLFSGPFAVVEPVAVAPEADGDDMVAFAFDLTVQPGETVSLLHFAAQNRDTTWLASQPVRLLGFPPVAFQGLTPDQQKNVVNMNVIPDSDLDGLDDEREIALGTDPDNPDSDGDGMRDGFEVFNDFDPLDAADGNADADGDGLDNKGEDQAGTDPRNPDSDGDGLNDGQEVLTLGTDPRLPDTDGDGLDDGEEVLVWGTDPLRADTDGGGRDDGEEVHERGTDPLDPGDDLEVVLVRNDASAAPRLHAFDGESGALLDSLVNPGDPAQPFGDCVITADGRRALVSFSPGEEILVIDPSVRPMAPIAGDALVALPGRATSLTLVPTGKFVLACLASGDASVAALDSATGAVISSLALPSFCEELAACGDGTVIMSTVGQSALRRLMLTDDGNLVDTGMMRHLDVHVSEVTCAPDSASVVAVDEFMIATSYLLPDFQPAGVEFLPGLFVQDAEFNLVDGSLYVFRAENNFFVRPGRLDRITYDPFRGTFLSRLTSLAMPGIQAPGPGHGLAFGRQQERALLITEPAVRSFTVNDLVEIANIDLPPTAQFKSLCTKSTLDHDGDGIATFVEIQRGTNPRSADSDGDGLSDLFEMRHGMNPLDPDDADADPDGDGLSTLEEHDLWLNPLVADSDGDGLSDGDEVKIHGTQPRVADTDADGLLDGREVLEFGTDPLNFDTDGGGTGDGDEVLNDLTDPLRSDDDLSRTLFFQTNLYDGGGYQWGMLSTGLLKTTRSGQANSMKIRINGTELNFRAPRVSKDEKVWAINTKAGEDLEFTRQVYVPGDETFARFLDLLRNTGDTPQSVSIELIYQLPHLSAPVVLSSDGDTSLSAADDFFVADPSGNSLFQAFIHAGPGGRVLVDSTETFSDGSGNRAFLIRYNLELPAFGEAALLHFSSQRPDLEGIGALAARLTSPDEAALDRMPVRLRKLVVNFDLPVDTDGDGLFDADELVAGTDPENADSDGDGLLDGFEVRSGMNPLLVDDVQADADGDGLTTLEEQAAGTDPLDADSDDDGLLDGDELLIRGTDPLLADSDGDEHGDAVDICPLTADPDQGDALHPGGGGDACEDFDGDGHADVEDNCPDEANPDQADTDKDQVGDACDPYPDLALAILMENQSVALRDVPVTSTLTLVERGSGDPVNLPGIRFGLQASGDARWVTGDDGDGVTGGSNVVQVEMTDGRATLSLVDSSLESVQIDLMDQDRIGLKLVGQFRENFELSNGGMTGGSLVWEHGIPEFGPPGAASGRRVWGTQLAGYYSLLVGTNPLRTKAFFIPEHRESMVSLKSWRDLDFAPLETAAIRVVGADKKRLLGVIKTLKGSSAGWETLAGDLSPWAGQEVMLEFVLDIDRESRMAGWYIDDLEVSGPGPGVLVLPADGDEDGDGVPNAQELATGTDPFVTDTDRDTIDDGEDNCPLLSNRSQMDEIHPNGIGDLCDDPDDDGVVDFFDNCPDDANPDQFNGDFDSIGAVCDNCPTVGNQAQLDDIHPNGIGDSCDDPDADGWADDRDNCPDVNNPLQKDEIHPNHLGDACEDPDMDAVVDAVDNCPDLANSDQLDGDGDNHGDACDICPQVPNPDQDDELACGAMVQDGGQCLESTVDLLPLQENGTYEIVARERFAVSRLTMEVMAFDCSFIFEQQRAANMSLELNGVDLGTLVLASPLTCSCAPEPVRLVIDDAALLAEIWRPGGNNEIRALRSEDDTGQSRVASVRIVVEGEKLAQSHCLFDLNKKDCTLTSLCVDAGATEKPLDLQSTLGPFEQRTTVSTGEFREGKLPDLISIDDVPSGFVDLCLSGVRAPRLYASSFIGELVVLNKESAAPEHLGWLPMLIPHSQFPASRRPLFFKDIAIDEFDGTGVFTRRNDGFERFNLRNGRTIDSPSHLPVPFLPSSPLVFQDNPFVGPTLYAAALISDGTSIDRYSLETGQRGFVFRIGGHMRGLATGLSQVQIAGLSFEPNAGIPHSDERGVMNLWDIQVHDFFATSSIIISPFELRLGAMSRGPDGTLYALGDGDFAGRLYTLDEETGVAQEVGDSGNFLLRGLAWRLGGDLNSCLSFVRDAEEVLAVNGAACGPPTASAGVDQVTECASAAGSPVLLDGTASSDPNSTPGTRDDIVSYEWWEIDAEGARRQLGAGETLAVTLLRGTHRVVLRVTDTFGTMDEDEVSITVADTTPPQLSLGVTPAVLWPPNHGLVPVDISAVATDSCGTAGVTLMDVTSSEPDDAPGSGDGSTTGDISGAEMGAADTQILLRAERAGEGTGRVYVLHYLARDEAGLTVQKKVEVLVPHDKDGTSTSP